ncbi:dynamin family protein [Desulfoscipio gibsoniae]
MQTQPSIAHFFSQVDELTEIHLTQEEIPDLIVMGPYNSGKSTLINNLLGQRLSPVDIIPATPAPIRFSYGERFLAQINFTDRQVHALTADELAGFLTRKKLSGLEITGVEVQLRHNLLKKMHLLDTPGIDAIHESSPLPGRLPQSDLVVYLLQQRGLNDLERRQIQQLVHRNGPGNISFWINCNLGNNHDGTSLEESRRILRQICGIEVTVHLINTMDIEDIRKFQLFIENQAAVFKLQEITDKLKKRDLQIPEMIAESMREYDDAKFLVQFWPAIEQARLIVQSQNTLKTMPPVTQQIASLLKKPTHSIIDPDGVTIVYNATGPRQDPVVIREKIISLLEQAIADPSLRPYKKSIGQLESLHSQITKENYLVTAAGGFSSGKSTFFNALMGEAMLPAENRPTTFAITRLKYGSHKKATINYARQVTIPTHYIENQQAALCQREMFTLEHWITDPELLGQIYAMEKSKNGRLTRITAAELLKEIELLKKSFARVKRNFPNNKRPWKSLFKKISAQKFSTGALADNIIVHFKDTAHQTLELDSPAGRAALAKIAGSHLALRVSDMVIEHPAKSLRLATFVDTPGLDSVYRHHREITTRYLPSSDCFLFFLNGKHILTQPDMGILQMLHRAMQNKLQADHRLFIVVNFADTLTAREQDKIYNYLQEYLVKPSSRTINPKNIYFISALDALTGRNKTTFTRFIRYLQESIWELRCAANYRQAIQNFKSALPGVSQETENSLFTEDKQLVSLKSEVEALLKEIRQRTANWQEQIASFNSREDLRGFRDGQKLIKQGFLNLSRKTVTVPSCRDMSASINSLLSSFHSKWSNHINSPTISGLNVTDLQRTIDELLEANFELTRARGILIQYVNTKANLIYSSVETMQNTIESKLNSNLPAPEGPNISPETLAAAHRYTAEINKLEEATYGIRRDSM